MSDLEHLVKLQIGKNTLQQDKTTSLRTTGGRAAGLRHSRSALGVLAARGAAGSLLQPLAPSTRGSSHDRHWRHNKNKAIPAWTELGDKQQPGFFGFNKYAL